MTKGMGDSPLFMLVAGELSGDQLGAGLIKSLKSECPNARFFGIGGPEMIREGLESVVPIEKLSVMGLTEVIKELPQLLALKKQLFLEAKAKQPIAFIGIDAPDFNLRLAKSLKKKKLTTTFQYVSPSVWVWRKGRIKTVKRYIDRILCLFPFEVDLYRKHNVDAVCVGHRLGDEIPLSTSTNEARNLLELDTNLRYLAVLPGSRLGEISRLLPVFCEAIEGLAKKYDDLNFLIPAASVEIYNIIETVLHGESMVPLRSRIKLFRQTSRLVMQASDVVLLASGTASLEAMLLKKPMVVAYRFNTFTAWLAPKIVNITRFSLPNILSGKALVPELFQNEVTSSNIIEHIGDLLQPDQHQELLMNFQTIHESLRLDSDSIAAQAVINKLKECAHAECSL